LTVILENINVK